MGSMSELLFGILSEGWVGDGEVRQGAAVWEAMLAIDAQRFMRSEGGAGVEPGKTDYVIAGSYLIRRQPREARFVPFAPPSRPKPKEYPRNLIEAGFREGFRVQGIAGLAICSRNTTGDRRPAVPFSDAPGRTHDGSAARLQPAAKRILEQRCAYVWLGSAAGCWQPWSPHERGSNSPISHCCEQWRDRATGGPRAGEPPHAGASHPVPLVRRASHRESRKGTTLSAESGFLWRANSRVSRGAEGVFYENSPLFSESKPRPLFKRQ